METAQPAAVNAVTGIVGRERVRAFDLAAGLAVFFMILVHVLWHWGARETWTTPIGEAISMAAGPTAAPVFLFLMGASLGAAPRTRVGTLAARGLWLVLLGYVLNFLRGVIPANLGLATGVITAEQVDPYTTWWLATTVDLHHVVGLSLVVIALLRARVQPGLALARPGRRARPRRAVGADGQLRDARPRRPADPVPRRGTQRLLRGRALAGLPAGRRGLRRDDRSVRGSGGSLPTRVPSWARRLLAIGGLLIVVQQPGFDVFTYWRMPLSFAVAIFGIILLWLAMCDLATRRHGSTAASGSCTAGATASSPSTSRTGSSSAGASASSGSGRSRSRPCCWRWPRPSWPPATCRASPSASSPAGGSAPAATREESEVAVVVRAA